MSWIKKRNQVQSLEILEVIAKHCAENGGTLARTLYEHVLKSDLPFVASFDFGLAMRLGVGSGFSSVSDLIYARQINALFAKQSDLDLGVDRRAAALSNFLSSEEKCRETNLRFRSCKPGNARVESVLHTATRKIADILGECPSLDAFDFSFGPGANTNVKGSVANAKAKLSAQLECSANLAPFVEDFLAEVPLLTRHHASSESDESFNVDVAITQGKLQFVPKNYKTLRSIVVEPTLNGLFQKGVGTYIRDRLGLAGVDLRDQSRNQRLALASSVTGENATLDLSCASDTIARELIRAILPYDWFVLLDSLRTPAVRHEGKTFVLQKFSSMGNAYTFELESLVFYALAFASAITENQPVADVSVYGDDIIVPVNAVSRLVEVLEFCGFSVNLEKSFFSGPFRESCGCDYYSGIDVRPIYVKTCTLSDADLYVIHNWFVRRGELTLAKALVPFMNSAELLYGPDGYGDGHLIGSHSTYRTRKMTRRGWEGSLFDTYSLKPRHFYMVRPGDWVYPSYSVYVRSGQESMTEPDIVRGSQGYRKTSIYTLETTIFRR